MGGIASLTLSGVKLMLGGAQRSNKFFTMLLTKTQLIPLPIIPLSIIATTFPGRELSELEFNDMGTKYSIAGDVKFNDWTVTIRTFNYLDYRQIKSWFELIHTPMEGTRALPSEYKSMCTVSQTNHTSPIPLTNLLLKGVYPKSIGDVTLSEDSPDLVTFDVTFNVDDIMMM